VKTGSLKYELPNVLLSVFFSHYTMTAEMWNQEGVAGLRN